MALPQEQHYTFADYLQMPDNFHAELINGVFRMMATPNTIHQRISMLLSVQLYQYLIGKPCEVFAAPFAVRLFEQEGDCPSDVDIVVEPDIMVICDPKKVDEHGCRGAPDFIVEILSPVTQRHDRLTKLQMYQRAGVREYWIVDPNVPVVIICILQNGVYLTTQVDALQPIPVHVLDGCTIDLRQVFGDTPSKPSDQ